MNEDFWLSLYEATDHGACPARPELSAIVDAVEHQSDLHPAFWHPLGFIHFRLHTHGAKSLRLHLWPQGRRQPEAPFWPIHDHIFNIRSVILVGVVRNSLYNVTAMNHSDHRIYEVSYGGSDSTLNQLTATSHLVIPHEALIEDHAAGSTYSIQRTIFHQSTVPDNQWAATLVITSEPLSLPPRVIGDTTALSTIDVRRRRCVARDLQPILAEFRALL